MDPIQHGNLPKDSKFLWGLRMCLPQPQLPPQALKRQPAGPQLRRQLQALEPIHRGGDLTCSRVEDLAWAEIFRVVALVVVEVEICCLEVALVVVVVICCLEAVLATAVLVVVAAICFLAVVLAVVVVRICYLGLRLGALPPKVFPLVLAVATAIVVARVVGQVVAVVVAWRPKALAGIFLQAVALGLTMAGVLEAICCRVEGLVAGGLVVMCYRVEALVRAQLPLVPHPRAMQA